MSMSQRILTVCIFILMLLVKQVWAFEPTARFNHIKVGDGLPHHSVTAMVEDNHGLIWFGTVNGLVRFDGYRFINFGATPLNGESLLSQNISTLYADDQGMIWIGTWSGGLSRLDVNQAKLVNFEADFNKVYAIKKFDQHRLLVATDTGVKLIPMTQQVSTLDIEQSWLEEPILTVLPVGKQKLMIGTQASLLLLDINTNERQEIALDGKDYFSPRQLLRDNDGAIWLSSTAGLYYLTVDDFDWVRVSKNIVEPALISSLVMDDEGSIWAGSAYHGIYQIKGGPEGTITQYQYDKSNRYTIADNNIMSLLVDKTGMLWVGTYNDGLSHLDLNSLSFGLYLDNDTSIGCLPNPSVWAILEQQQYLWLGTQTGAVRINRANGECLLLSREPSLSRELSKLGEVSKSGENSRLKSLPHPTVKAFYQDSRGQFWLGTGKGLVRFDDSSNALIAVDGKLAKLNINFIVEDSEQRLVVGTAVGLYRQDAQGNFYRAPLADKGLFNIHFNYFAKDQQGKLWFATNKGLAYLDLEQNNIDFVAQINEPIWVIHIDENNEAWITGKKATLFRFNLNNKLLIKFNQFESIPQAALFFAVVPDKQGNLWWSTSHGLWRFNKLNQSSQMFGFNNGLASDNFNPRAVFTSENGHLYFGSRGGLNYFDPDKIRWPALGPKAILTGFSWFNHDLTVELKPVNNGDNNGDSHSADAFTLPTAVSALQQLILSHTDKIFAFEFAADDFSDVKNNTFAYRLVGLDENWTYANAHSRRAMYNNVPAGHYQFEVKAANKNGIWGQEVRTVAIDIKPAPWLTPIAFLVYAMIAIIAVVLFIRIRTASLTKTAMLLQQQVDQRTKQLKQEKQRVELLLEQKNDEFVNVSHEFRTPLTLVLDPVTQLLNSGLADEHKSRLTVVKRNGLRLLRMVDQLLHIEKFRAAQAVKPKVVSLRSVMSLICHSFTDVAEQQGIDLEVEDIADVNLLFTADGLEKIILNLLSNAFKYTLPGGSVTVGASIDGGVNDSKGTGVVIYVSDTGIGIAPEQQPLVFKRFHRVLDQHAEQVTGAGIGLALVKELVESHQGQISLNSELGKGTSIAVILPIVTQQQLDAPQLNQEIIELELASVASGQAQTITVPEQQQIADESKPTVLIVEDNPDMRHYIYAAMAADYHCVLCANGQLGYEKAVEIIPDIVVSDVMMPVMDGFALTKALKSDEKTSHIPVVLLTARDDKQSRLQGWHEKADEYLTKPFDSQELKIRVNNLLAIRDILRDRFNQNIFVVANTTETTEKIKNAHRIDESEANVEANVEQIAAAAEQQKLLAQQQAQQQFLQKLNDAIEQVYSSQSVTIGQIAKQVALGERQLFRKLKATVDMNPTEYLRRFRLQKACELLGQGMNSSRVALEVGFSSHSYFTRCFSAQYGYAPSQYLLQQSAVA